MLKIFAKHGTDEKVLVACDRLMVGNVQELLANKYGGNWVWVDKVNVQEGEILHFSDGLTYLGFHGRDERYSSFIESIN